MKCKILYIEDADPSTIIANLESHNFTVEHHNPEDFETSIMKATDPNIDLLLLDFRLSNATAIYDAPTLAQTIRTMHTTNHRDLPIVLISTEENISGYYKDYTSQDLFDFAITKDDLSTNLEKYSIRMNSLIHGYRELTKCIAAEQPLETLLNVPQSIQDKLSPKIIDLLDSDKYKKNSFMASSFILNHLVKPSGVLVGEDILASRLGVDIKSPGWGELKEHFNDIKYTGVYSDSYTRWWSAGIELWWKANCANSPSIKRSKAIQRVEKIKEIIRIENIEPAQKIEYSKSDYFWTICNVTKKPLDPMDGFEMDRNIEPWEDAVYLSLLGVSESESPKVLKILDRKRYNQESKEL